MGATARGSGVLPVWRLIQTAIRRRASWLAPSIRLAAGLPKSANHQNLFPRKGCNPPTANSGKQKPHKGYMPVCLQLWGKQKPSLLDASKPSICRKTPPRKSSLPTPTAGKQSGDRQRRGKSLAHFERKKSEHERARTPMLAVQPCCARHCELPLSKMRIKRAFSGPRRAAGFLLHRFFFRHRKKKCERPMDGQSQSAPESARQSPKAHLLTAKVVAYRCKQGLSARPCTLRIASEVNGSTP